MANVRTPTGMAKLTGAFANHPERFKDRVDPTEGKPAGMPPETLNEVERLVWFRFVMSWPWVTDADRTALTSLCRVTAIVEDATEPPKIGLLNVQRLLLSEFGATPSSRSKVMAPADPDEGKTGDPFAQFGSPGNA